MRVVVCSLVVRTAALAAKQKYKYTHPMHTRKDETPTSNGRRLIRACNAGVRVQSNSGLVRPWRTGGTNTPRRDRDASPVGSWLAGLELRTQRVPCTFGIFVRACGAWRTRSRACCACPCAILPGWTRREWVASVCHSRGPEADPCVVCSGRAACAFFGPVRGGVLVGPGLQQGSVSS